MKTDKEKLAEMEEGIRRLMRDVRGYGGKHTEWVTDRLRALLPKRYKRPELVEKFYIVRAAFDSECSTARLLDSCKAFIFEEEGE